MTLRRFGAKLIHPSNQRPMSGKINVYGDTPPAFDLDAQHRADQMPIQPIMPKADVIIPPAPSAPTTPAREPEQLQLLSNVEARREEVQETLAIDEAWVEEINELVYMGDFARAQELQQEANIDISGDPEFLRKLTEKIDEVTRGDIHPDGTFFRLFYMLGGNFRISSVLGLEGLMKLVFKTYYEEVYSQRMGRKKHLEKMISMFGDQIGSEEIDEFIEERKDSES